MFISCLLIPFLFGLLNFNASLNFIRRAKEMQLFTEPRLQSLQPREKYSKSNPGISIEQFTYLTESKERVLIKETL